MITQADLINQFGHEWFALNPDVLQQVLANGRAGAYYNRPYLYGVYGGPNDARFDWIIPYGANVELYPDPQGRQWNQGVDGLLINTTGDPILSDNSNPQDVQDSRYYASMPTDMGGVSEWVLKQPYLDAWRRLNANNLVQVSPNHFNGSFLSLGATGGFRDPRLITWDPVLGLVSPQSNFLYNDDDPFNTYIGLAIMAGLAAMAAPAIAAQGASSISSGGAGASASAGGAGVADTAAGWVSAEGGAGYAGGVAADASELATAATAATDAPSVFDSAQLNFSSPDPFEAVANTGTGVDPSVIDTSNIDFASQASFTPMNPAQLTQPDVPWDTGISVDLNNVASSLPTQTPGISQGSGGGGSSAADGSTPTASTPANVLRPSSLLNDANSALSTAGKLVSIIGAGTALKDAQTRPSAGGGTGGGSGGYHFMTTTPVPLSTTSTSTATPTNWLLIAALVGGAYLITRRKSV